VSNPALDPAVIDALRQLTPNGEEDVVREVLTLFRDGAPERLAAIREACRARDADALGRTAHEFKGASATIGAFALQQCCRDLELAAQSETVEGSAALLDALSAEYARVDAAITKLLR
jgi:HPt (histidine-containing phosphotransfer) domain-containing protein